MKRTWKCYVSGAKTESYYDVIKSILGNPTPVSGVAVETELQRRVYGGC